MRSISVFIIGTAAVLLLATAGIAEESYKTIVVKKGDTLGKIAKEHLNDPAKWKEMLKYNKIANPNLIVPGLKLKIPASLGKGAFAFVIFKLGSVEYKRDLESNWNDAQMRGGLYEKDSIRTGKGGKARLKVGSGALLDLAGNTEISMDDLQPGKSTVALKSGAMVSLFRKDGKSGFSIRTPSAVAAVRGTEFFSTADEAGNSSFGCYEGKVEVEAQNRKVELNPGFATKVEKGKPPSQPFKMVEPPEVLEVKQDK